MARPHPDRHDRLTERDDDDARVAFGEVRRLDVPAFGAAEREDAVVDRQRRDPAERARPPPALAGRDGRGGAAGRAAQSTWGASRSLNECSTRRWMDGERSSRAVKWRWAMTSARVGSVVVTVAVAGTPETREISPKNSEPPR